ncbi:hypothetical protein DEO23_11320 [Brachybacterium endophyticum]|uniref:Leucine-binding protein domain-containing protein n=1 Tax=Brachybacterium endophyticum TaxID=2182385 RepID=A0A2U2RJ14_9MICO|nr:ABC transporter substrate-binding protein [Brachybacterium endophyticum]PWH05785.1 hypothetical protein DEO23_11320 [Brachybacterium endophyticum]
MSLSRRTLVRGLGASVLGASTLVGCRTDDPSKPTDPASGEGPPTDAAPEDPLRIALVTTSLGPVGDVRRQVEDAVAEGIREINYDGGVFGRDVELFDPHVVEHADEDLGAVAKELGPDGEGASALILAVDDAQLVDALPDIAATGMVILSPTSSSTRVRAEGGDAGLLFRLAPTQEAVATVLVEEAVGTDPKDRGGEPGTIAFLGTDDEASNDLRDQLVAQGRPKGAKLVLEKTYGEGELGDVAGRARAIAKAKPAMLVLTGGAETTDLLRALHTEIADDRGRPEIEIAVRLVGPAVRDHAQDHLPKDALSGASGLQAGGPVPETFRLWMLNRDSSLLELGPPGMAAATQAYDSLALICLAARQAQSLEGATIAGAVPGVLTGSEECTSLEACTTELSSQQQVGETPSIAYRCASGDLALGEDRDLVSGQLRSFDYSESGAIGSPQATDFELAGD